MERTINRIKKYFWWPTMKKDIKKFISNCVICEKAKVRKHTKTPITVSSVADKPFQKLYLDIVGPITPSISGNKYILTCECDLTKFSIAVPIPDATAFTTARSFVHEVILKYNLPEEIVTDNGPNFISDLFTQVNKILRVKKRLTTPYNPKANLVERWHRSLAHYLRSYAQDDLDNWDIFLNFAVHSYNSTPHSTTG